jgi:hypothetical protein
MVNYAIYNTVEAAGGDQPSPAGNQTTVLDDVP